MATRIDEGLVFGAIWNHAATNITDVTFYPPELEPDVSASKKWCMLEIDYDDQATTGSDWIAEGRATAYISARKIGGNIYAARATADDLSTNFAKGDIVVVESEVTKGYIRCREPRSVSRGITDGVIEHWWTIEFRVYSVS